MATRPEPRLTYEDYLHFPDDGRRRELVDGEVHVIASPNLRHQRIVLRLARTIADHLDRYGGGEVVVSPFDVVLTEHDVVQPDVVFVAEPDAGVLTAANARGTPTWVIEVLSDPSYDRRLKRQLYARTGVGEYWIVDPNDDRVEVYLLEEGTYREPEVLGPGESASPRALPDLRIDVSDVLRR